jgi:diguanylate cyclase (GGDEF)-like protein
MRSSEPSPPRWTHWIVAASAVVVAARALDVVLDPFAPAVAGFLARFTTGAVFAGAAALGVARGRRSRDERFAWWSLATALLLWGAGDLYFSSVLADRSSVPFPSLSDGLWLAFYLPAYAAIYSLLRARASSVPRAAWLDALIGGLGVGSAAAVVAFGVVLDHTDGTAVETAVNLAYPVGDLGLLALVVVAVTVSGWRVPGVWRRMAPAFAIFVLADSVYLVQVAEGTYALGGFVDLGWPAAALLIGLAAQQPRTIEPERVHKRAGILLPATSGLAALALLVMDHFIRTNPLALGLATSSILLILVRQYVAVRDNGRLLDQSRREATTDALTGLGNRRQLASDLTAQLDRLDPAHPLTLTMFDLDGFKGYNDTFGHPAGDQLLERLATRLAGVLAGRGTAYRMGGDEFCTLWTPSTGDRPTVTTAEVVAALSEQGDAFSIRCSHGSVTLPTDTDDAEAALRIADREMYLCKRKGRLSAGRQSVDVLHRVLAERDQALGDHLDAVADLATGIASRLRLSQGDCDLTVQTALLHDIGKVAIPDAILDKPGPLDAAESAFMQQHTIIGERIIMAAPSLAAVANDAMTAERPHLPARSKADAIAELRRCAGTQFDPAAVESFVSALEDRPGAAAMDADTDDRAPVSAGP